MCTKLKPLVYDNFYLAISFFTNPCFIMSRRQYSHNCPLNKVKVSRNSSSDGRIFYNICGLIRINTEHSKSIEFLSSFDNCVFKSEWRPISSSSSCLRFWVHSCWEHVRCGDSKEVMVVVFKWVDCCLVNLGTNSTWAMRDCYDQSR